MRDLILDAKAQEAPQRFIASIDQSEILKLASSYHDNEPCQVFQPVKHGSFNVCFFVQFATPSSDGVPDRWVVRLPIPEEVPWIDEKMDVEIATMKYVAANTTIPVPRIRAHSSAKNSPIKMAFIIMDYIKGKNLRELGFPKDLDVWYSGTTQPTKAREKMYQNLAQVYIQLRQLEFPEIGALGLPKEDHDQSIRVRHRPLCIEILLQQREDLAPASRFPEHKTFKTSKEYVDALLWLGENLLDKGTNSMLDIRGERGLYASHDFRRFVMESWLDAAQDCGPFVLVHGDLAIQNLLWDDDLNLVAVLDWEWSSVMPLQFFVPPPWLDGSSIDFLCHGQILYNSEASKLCEIVRDEEKSLGLACSTLLSDEWDRRKGWCHTLVVCALLRPEYVFDAYWFFISYTLVGFLPRTPQQTKKYVEITSRQIALFMENDDRKAFLSRKQEEQKVYLKEEEDYFGPLDDCQDIGN
ncbi:hypothetical protein MHUMG1_07738 [Metarhizium humberi]|uniref:Aminoglycoside phosphotransferase domain-containing protein n=1 Tax=Metarhizium humberi TaxID=2596975 RepID=A0A9P8M5M7_9HYPO|nr:hypothetical protein MHUMG1_07738 [Metarhizium humberi]